MEYSGEIFEKRDEILICLTDKAKEYISKYNEIEQFIDENFPRNELLDLQLFKVKSKNGYRIGLKVKDKKYALLLQRSVDRKTENKENYFVCIGIKKLNIDENYENLQSEVKIPINWNKRYIENNSDFYSKIEEIVERLDFFTPKDFTQNSEYQKWYAYLKFLEKLIDEKEFIFEANIVYKAKQAVINIQNLSKELKAKIKKARRESFLYYEKKETKGLKIHEIDEKIDSRNRDFGILRNFNDTEIIFDLDESFIKKFKSKNKGLSLELDNDFFALEARRIIEEFVRQELNVDKVTSKEIKRLNHKNKKEILKVYNQTSKKIHKEEIELDKKQINKTLIEISDEKQFNPPSKLILRVSYFREQFQLKVLKNGMERIKNHILANVLFGDEKLKPIDEEELKNFSIEFYSDKLNDKQKEAIKKSLLAEKLFMIQGPPGTGKTEVIAELAYQEAIRGKKVLISSQANMAVDNALMRLKHPKLYPIRRARKDYEIEDNLPTIDNLEEYSKNKIINNIQTKLDEIDTIKAYLEKENISKKLNDVLKKYIDIGDYDLEDEDDYFDFKSFLEKNSYKLEENIDDYWYYDIQKEYISELKDYSQEDKNILKKQYENNINIIGATLFETGKRDFLGVDIAIIDEVSKAMPPELILPILRAKKVILVGDHKQLPPIIKDVSLEELAEEIGEDVDFDKTIFEELIRKNPNHYVMLDTQYRMHHHIQNCINHFYDNILKCGVKNPDIEKCHGLDLAKNKHLIWFDTKKEKDLEEKIGTSYINKKEVEIIKQLLEELNNEAKQKNKILSVGVITFYGRQLGELIRLEKKGFYKEPLKNGDRNYSYLDIKFGTVDRFQGQEREIIIVSLVRNNKDFNIGFAKKPERINVAFSRAQKLLVVVGNSDNFCYSKTKSSKIYKNVFNLVKNVGEIRK